MRLAAIAAMFRRGGAAGPEETRGNAAPRPPLSRWELWIPAAYALTSGVWIAVSDLLVEAAPGSARDHTVFSIFKGFGWLAATTALLHAGLRWASARERAALARVEASEALLRAVIDAMPDPVFVKDRDSRWLFANPATYGVVGKGPADTVGKTDREIYEDAAIAEAVLVTDRRVMESGEPATVEEVIQTPDAPRVFLSAKAPVRDARGRIIGIVGTARDVTERRRAEEALRRYELLARISGDVMLFVRRDDGRILEANAAASAAYGYSNEELRALTVHALRAAEAAASVERQLAEADAHGTRFETVHRRKDGRTFPVEVSSAGTEIGGVRTILSVVRDVSERRRAENALADRERYLETILQTALDGFYVVDPEGRIVEVNEAYCAMSGYSRDELLAMRVADVEALETPRETAAHIERIRAHGEDRFETRHRRKDGTIIDVASSVRYLSERGGQFVCFIRDITDEKRAREALSQSEERFRALIERATDILVLLDAEGRIVFWSPGAVKALGWTQDEARRFHATDLVGEEDRSAWREALEEMAAFPGDVVRLLTRQRHKDGSWRLIEVTGRNLLHDDAVGCVIANMRDVTEQRRLEEQFNQAQKLESIGRLAGGVAHDFNNLLTVILSCSEALGEDVRTGAPASLEDIDEIRSAGARARDLTRQLLAFARKDTMAPVALDLGGVLRSSEKLLRRLLGEDVELRVRWQADPWLVFCDPGQLEQVILNLAVNARDAMPAGGTLTLETANVEIHEGEQDRAIPPELAPGCYVRLAVQDSGAGMSADVRDRIFEPFFTTKEVGKGTGLGLAMVYGVVKQSNGFIRVESEPGHGARFEIWLPRTLETERRTTEAERVDRASGTETVLLVEDDFGIRKIAARALRSGGYRVLVAAGGVEALEVARRERRAPDLVVTDVVMPGLDGRAVAEEMLRRYPGVRILHVSGHAGEAIAQHGLHDSGLNFLRKPFTPTALLAHVRAVLDAPREPALLTR